MGSVIATRIPINENHRGTENSGAENEWDKIITETHKLPYFHYDITMWGLSICKVGSFTDI